MNTHYKIFTTPRQAYTEQPSPKCTVHEIKMAERHEQLRQRDQKIIRGTFANSLAWGVSAYTVFGAIKKIPVVSSVLEFPSVSFGFACAQAVGTGVASIYGAVVGAAGSHALFKEIADSVDLGSPLLGGGLHPRLPENIWSTIATFLPFEDQRRLREVSPRFQFLLENKRNLPWHQARLVSAQSQLRHLEGGAENPEVTFEANFLSLVCGCDLLQKRRLLNPSLESSPYDWIVSLFPNDAFFDLPVVNMKNADEMKGSGTGYLDYLDPASDFTAPLMRGYDYAKRPFLAALISIKNDPISEAQLLPEDARQFVHQMILFQRYMGDPNAKNSAWVSFLIGPRWQVAQFRNLDANNNRPTGSLLAPGLIDFKDFQNSERAKNLRDLFLGGVVTESGGTELRLFKSMDEALSG